MERITQTDLKALLKSEKTEAERQLDRRQQNLELLSILIEQMRANLPNQQLTQATVESWMGSWLLLVDEYGFQALQQALQRLLTRCKFFPLPAEIREEIEAERDRQCAQRQQREARQTLDKLDRDFWYWVDEQIAYTGQSEQEILNKVRTPGYTGLRARRKTA